MGGAALVVLLWENVKGSLRAILTLSGVAIARAILNDGQIKWDALSILTFVIFALYIISTLVKYFSFRFHIADGMIHTEQRVLSLARKHQSIPIDRIHNISSRSNLFYRLVDMEYISIDSTATNEAEITLILTEAEAKALRNYIGLEERELHAPEVETTDGEISRGAEIQEGEATLGSISLTRRDHLLGALSQSHVRAISLLITSLLALGDDLLELFGDKVLVRISETFAQSTVEEWSEGNLSPWSVLQVVAVLYLILVVLWSIPQVLRQWGARVDLYSDRLELSAGLIASIHRRIRSSQIVFLSLKTNPIEHLLGLSSLRITQASNAGKQGEKEAQGGLLLYGWRERARLYRWWGIDTEPLEELRPNRRMLSLYVGGCLVLHGLAFGVMWFTEVIEWGILLLPTLLLALGATRGAYYHRRLVLTSTHLCVYHGRIAQIESWIALRRIERLTLSQTPMQRRSGRCTLKIDTMSETFSIPFASLEEARHIQDHTLYLIER
ncbi:hypothetical protein HQ37_01745 [Porphyromonas sp. COT-239 OH1446]|nr:hypothetical protein HQ37_01745 [Porphyromonas sp. COT-239 OH1446]